MVPSTSLLPSDLLATSCKLFRQAAKVAALLALAACGSAPLPPWQPATVLSARSATADKPAAPNNQALTDAPALTQPVVRAGSAEADAANATIPDSAPYSADPRVIPASAQRRFRRRRRR